MQYPIKTIRLTQGFGANPAFYKQYGQNGHNGLDFGISSGTAVYASENGTVYFEGWGKNSPLMGAVAGISCIIDHGNLMTGYAHLTNTVVDKGQKVVKGQLIGHTGNTGTSTGPHLHFEVFGKPVNINNGYYGRIDPNQFKFDACKTSTEITAEINARNKAIQDEAIKAQEQARLKAEQERVNAEKAQAEALKALEAQKLAEQVAKKAEEEAKQKALELANIQKAQADNTNFVNWLKDIFIKLSELLVSWRK